MESKFWINYGVVTQLNCWNSVSSQSESVPETEMLLPDTGLPQISQSEPSIPITTNEQSNVLESVEKPTAESTTLLIKQKQYPQRQKVSR